MPIAAVTSVLAAGLTPMFVAKTAPPTTKAAARAWARAYTQYVIAGGIPAAATKEAALGTALANAFRPELGGGGPALFLQALSLFWIGLPVPAQGGGVVAFVPATSIANNPQPENASAQQQARGLAQVIAGLTLGAVKVVVPLGPIPPGTIVPLL